MRRGVAIEQELVDAANRRRALSPGVEMASADSCWGTVVSDAGLRDLAQLAGDGGVRYTGELSRLKGCS
jgi:hypothetical protein